MQYLNLLKRIVKDDKVYYQVAPINEDTAGKIKAAYDVLAEEDLQEDEKVVLAMAFDGNKASGDLMSLSIVYETMCHRFGVKNHRSFLKVIEEMPEEGTTEEK